ncbi:phosphatidylinositol glycan anchor biosynthesis class F [Rhodnius prolixus]|uniref:Putative ethanolamine-p-transferase gpi11/pig-f n=1 Tax=Rhodnius prolixus TaxID=13249 RepID=R4FKV2_RHOPR
MLVSSEEEAIKKITIFYCALTSVSSTCLPWILLRSETHFKLGSRNIIPLFLVLSFLEIIKWCYQTIIFNNAYNFIFKKQSTFILLLNSINFSSIIQSVIVLAFSCAAFYIVSVLFGAEVFNHKEETLMFSLLLTNLTILPISVQFGSVHVANFIQRVKPNNEFDSLVFNNAYGTLLGAWFGAFVIPLDWDRPWQVWPIPCSLGALLGYSISNTLQLLQFILIYLRVYKEKFV